MFSIWRWWYLGAQIQSLYLNGNGSSLNVLLHKHNNTFRISGLCKRNSTVNGEFPSQGVGNLGHWCFCVVCLIKPLICLWFERLCRSCNISLCPHTSHDNNNKENMLWWIIMRVCLNKHCSKHTFIPNCYVAIFCISLNHKLALSYPVQKSHVSVYSPRIIII